MREYSIQAKGECCKKNSKPSLFGFIDKSKPKGQSLFSTRDDKYKILSGANGDTAI